MSSSETTATRIRAAGCGSSFAVTLLTLHVVLLSVLGQHYAKARLPLGADLYITEVLLVTILASGLRGVLSVPWDRITRAVVAFVAVGTAWVALSGLGATGAGMKAFSFFVYSGFYFVVRGSLTTDKDRWKLLHRLVLASIPGALIGLWQMKTGGSLFGAAEAFHTTSTGSDRWIGGEYALYGIFALLIVASRYTIQRTINGRTAALLAFAPAAELILAQHRSGFVALALALGACAVFLVGSQWIFEALAKFGIGAALSLAAVFYGFGSAYLDDTLARLMHTADAADVNVEWRLIAWVEVLHGILDNPAGHGFATWDFFFNWQDPLSGSHNSLLDLAYRVGLPGLALFLAITVIATMRTRHAIRLKGATENTLPIATCLCIYAFLAYSTFNVVFETPYMSIFFWILIGLAAGALPPEAHCKRASASVDKSLTAIAEASPTAPVPSGSGVDGVRKH